MAWFNRGIFLLFGWGFRGVAQPTNLYVALLTDATPPGPDHNTLGQLSQIAIGNGYTSGGYQLSRNTTDFDVLIQNNTLDRAELQIKDLVWVATGGNLPASGAGARWAVLTTDEATVANRQLIAYWSLGADRTVSATQTLTLQDLELRGLQAA